MIREEEKYDGFYAIATNLDLENTFQGKTSQLQKKNQDHSTFHDLLYNTALLIYRLLEVKLNPKERHFTTGEIIENLKNMNVVNNHDLYFQATYSSSKICEALNEKFGMDLDKEYNQPKVLNKKLKKILK